MRQTVVFNRNILFWFYEERNSNTAVIHVYDKNTENDVELHKHETHRCISVDTVNISVKKYGIVLNQLF